jgi:hypothetical protein
MNDDLLLLQALSDLGAWYERYKALLIDIACLAPLFRELETLGVGRLLLLPGNFLIYALVDPRDGQMRYIGSTQYPERRETEHRGDTRSNPEKVAWVKEVQEQGLQPIMRRLEIVQGGGAAYEREMAWVEACLEAGIDLLNVVTATSKGEGRARLPRWVTPERKEVIIRMYRDEHRSMNAICKHFGSRPGGAVFSAVKLVLEQEGLLEPARR